MSNCLKCQLSEEMPSFLCTSLHWTQHPSDLDFYCLEISPWICHQVDPGTESGICVSDFTWEFSPHINSFNLISMLILFWRYYS